MKEEGNEAPNSQDDFEGYSKSAKIQLFGLFFCLGILNHLGIILVMTGGRLLTIELNMKPYVTIYTSVSTIFSIIIRMVNSRLCLKVSYKKRVIIICFWMLFGYFSMFLVLTLHESILNGYNALCYILSFIPCFLLGASYAFGESAMIAYLRLFPKTLIAGWSSGTGVSGLVGGGLNLLTQLLNGLTLKFLYLLLTPLGFVYLFLFLWTFKLLKKDQDSLINEIIGDNQKEIEKDNINDNINDDYKIMNDDQNNENNDDKHDKHIEIKNINNNGNYVNNDDREKIDKIEEVKDDKLMDDMNKQNKTMSLINFMAVMKMCGRVIINLGFIYFTYFISINSLVIRNSNKIDIPFLPKSTIDNKLVRRGKYEFINEFFQLGMFTSKTFIKLVRKIQPIEVYTFAITTITIIYFIEYYTGFLPWWCFPIVNYILGFFSGGTYAGGFYVILHSGQVLIDYKELTVNIATLFNDGGTFLSGLVGYLLLNYVIVSDEPFKGQELE